jgi:hypothetical protein
LIILIEGLYLDYGALQILKMILYLDMMVVSNLAKPGGEAQQADLLSFLAKHKGSLAVGFHHLEEIAAIEGTRKHDGKAYSLREHIGEFLDRCPIVRFGAGPAVVDAEFKEAVVADSEHRPPHPIPVDDLPGWSWLPREGRDITPSSAIASVALSERWDAPAKRFKAIAEKNAAFRAQRKVDYESGGETKPRTLEDTLRLERDSLRVSLFKENAAWPSSRHRKLSSFLPRRAGADNSS